MSHEDYIPASYSILSLALALQLAAESYRAESILARGLKLPEPPDYFARCQALFDQYAPALKSTGLQNNRITFRTLMDAKPPEEMLHIPAPELASKWLFSAWRGWKQVEPALA